MLRHSISEVRSSSRKAQEQYNSKQEKPHTTTVEKVENIQKVENIKGKN